MPGNIQPSASFQSAQRQSDRVAIALIYLFDACRKPLLPQIGTNSHQSCIVNRLHRELQILSKDEKKVKKRKKKDFT
jgi:hypothetical protein